MWKLCAIVLVLTSINAHADECDDMLQVIPGQAHPASQGVVVPAGKQVEVIPHE